MGQLLKEGLYMSLISWEQDGILHEEYLENDEFVPLEDLGWEHEQETNF
jgi:hypothetical protein